MKVKTILAMVLLSGSTLAMADDNGSVQYVQICQLLGPGYLITPGDTGSSTVYTCLNPNTGLGATTADEGDSFIYNQSQLLLRISALEARLRLLRERLGIYQPEEGNEQ